jgi:circadian clock protein KaiB
MLMKTQGYSVDLYLVTEMLAVYARGEKLQGQGGPKNQMNTRNTKANSMHARKPAPEWNLSLYVAGLSPRSRRAFRNLQRICKQYLAGRYHIKVIDLSKNRQIARDQQIVATPTVERKSPKSIRRLIGDLSNTERVLAGLQIPLHD